MLILTSCSNTQEVIDDESQQETIIYTNNYDLLKYEPVSKYSESVNPNNSWIFEGDGTYEYGCLNNANYKKLNIIGTSSLHTSNIFINNGTYTISFNIISDVDTSINLNISSSKTYLNENMEIRNGSNDFSYTFNGSVDYNVSITFNFNNPCNIEINNFSLSSTVKTYNTRINQIGYLTNLEKEVVFNYNPGDYFGIYKADTDELVYIGTISETIHDNDSDSDVYKGFFKDVNQEGEYYIKSEFGSYSYNFTISNDAYKQLSYDVLHFIYVQRCGSEIVDDYNNLSHPACHTNESKIYTTLEDTYIDTTGGWHDAGDYGKYLYTTNQTIADLLGSILYGQSSEELLDEARYGLEFVLKLQKSSGDVYNKVVSKEFSAFVSPEYDNQETYVLWSWSESTATFAGCTGLAYLAYKDIDNDFANKCLEAHNKAMDFLYNNQISYNEVNPDGFNVGTYYVDNENDERLFAYSVAYRLSKDEKYLDLINTLIDSGAGGYYEIFSYVSLLDCLDSTNDLYTKVKESLRSTCNSISDEILSNGYPYPANSYMNSNGTCARYVSRLLLGSRYLRDERYLVRAAEAINYILGQNTLDLCFVYEYGYNSPQTIHNRLAVSHGQHTIKGALAGGVAALVSDNIISDYFTNDSPVATRWVDNIDAYSCVEPSINNNSSLVLALALLEYSNNNTLE